MGKGLIAVLGFMGLLVLGVCMAGCSYVSSRNTMVQKDQTVKSMWSEVDVQLERRAALIPKLDGAIGRLLLLTENYPQLRSSEQFMRLQDELSGTENRIGVARKRYNDAIQDYNTYILQFPNNIWAGMAGFKENDAYFKASESARAVPSVKF